MNKKGILGIALFVIVALFTYAFANPNERLEEEVNKGNNQPEQTNVEETTNEEVNELPATQPVVVNNPVLQNVIAPVQPTITNNPVINNNEEEIIDLTDAKNAAKEALKKYADSKNLDEKYLEELNEIIDNGNDNIDNSTNTENINKSLEDAKKEIDELALKAELDSYKEGLIEQLNNYYNELNFNDKEDEESTSKETLNNGISNINNALNTEDADKVLEDTKDNLDKLKAIEELIEYKNSKKFNDQFIERANTIVETGTNNINNNVENALENAKKDLDNLKSEQDLATAKIDAINKLKNYKNSLGFTGEYDTKANNIVLEGETAINNSTTINDVNTSLETYKTKLDTLKSEQDLANAKIDAINKLTNYKNSLDFTGEYDTKANNIVLEGETAINNSTTINDVNTSLETYKTKLDDLIKEQRFQESSKFKITFGTYETIDYTPYEKEVCFNFFGHKSCNNITVPDWTKVTHPNASIDPIQDRIWGFIPTINNVTIYYDNTYILAPSIVDVTNVKEIKVIYTVLKDGIFFGRYEAKYQIINNNGTRTTRMISNDKM